MKGNIMMKCRLLIQAAAVLCLAVLPGIVFGQVVAVQDFEGPLPGPQGYPGGYSFWGDGHDDFPDDPDNNAPDLTVVEEVTDLAAASGVQSFQINLDSSAINSWYYYGLGGFHGFWGEGAGAAGGQPGEDDPGNFVMSFDIQLGGVVSGDEVVEGNVSLYKADYETVNAVDLNNDGDMEDGFDIWRSNFSTNMGAAPGWVHVEWNLATGSVPTADALIATPIFDDESTFAFQLYPFNSPGGFGLDADNVINIDNLQLEFFPATATPGDFDGDSDVDGRDFLVWQRGESPVPLSATDLADWQNNYGAGGALASFAAVPEPGSLLLAAMSAVLVIRRRRRS
jgi:hypothetical protein